MIDAPGIFDLSEDVYHGDPAPAPSLSAGFAKTMLQASPFHAAAGHPRIAPTMSLPIDAREEESKFDLGKATHAIKTGKGGELVVVEADSWRSNAAKEVREEARAQGATALLWKDAKRVEAMCELVERRCIEGIGYDPFGRRENNEMAMFWKDGPVWCRAKPDAIDYDHRILWDLKTSGTFAEPNGWTKTQLKATAIDLRAAHYLHGSKCLLGPGWRYVFAVVEITWPHAVSFAELPGALLDTGEDERQTAVRTFGRCLEMGRWPAWPRGITLVEAPPYHEVEWIARRDRANASAETLRAARDMQAPN